MTEISVPVSTATFLELASFLREHGSDRDPVDVVESAIDYWMANASWKPELLGIEDDGQIEENRGYNWKGVFLPDGTVIRMLYKGETHHAKVIKDDIRYSETSVSPSEFCRTVTGTARNAWRDIWVKRPGDREFLLSSDLRRKYDGDKLLKELGL